MGAYENPDNMDQAFQVQPELMEDIQMSEGYEYQEPEYLPEGYERQELEHLPEVSFEETGCPAGTFSVFSGGVAIAPLNVAPTITFPGQGATVPLQALTLRWNLVSNATYILAVRNVTNDDLIVPNTSLPVGRNNHIVPVNRLTPGHQYRFALASVVGGVTRWAGHRYFRVQSIATPAPTITNPTAGAVVPRQILSTRWNAVAGATSYLVSLRNLTSDTLWINRGSLTGTTRAIQANQLSSGHRYRLAVASVFGTVERWSNRYFSVQMTEAERSTINPRPPLTGILRTDIVQIARSQIYVRAEGNSGNHNAFSRSIFGVNTTHHWCGDFAAWVLRQVGRHNHVVHNWNRYIHQAQIGEGWNFSFARNWGHTPNHGRWNPVSAANVLPGDIVLWQDHIAFVASVSTNNITFVGGNQGRQVDERTATRNNPEWGNPRQTFLGYFRVV